MTTAIYGLGGLIIFALGIYAGYLHWQLWRQRRQQKPKDSNPGASSGASSGNSDTEVSAAAMEWHPPVNSRSQLVSRKKSIYLLSEAILDEKMTHTEGCIRICAIANCLDDSGQFRRDFSVLFDVAEATAHIPILQDWQALEKAEKKAFNDERRGIEGKYADAVIEAAQRIRNRYRKLLSDG